MWIPAGAGVKTNKPERFLRVYLGSIKNLFGSLFLWVLKGAGVGTEGFRWSAWAAVTCFPHLLACGLEHVVMQATVLQNMFMRTRSHCPDKARPRLDKAV